MWGRKTLYLIALTFAVVAVVAGRIAIAPSLALHAPATSDVAGAAAAILPATTTPNVYPVAKVVDGDTIDVMVGGAPTRIRIIGMDTPEIVDPRKPLQCYAREASSEGHRLLESQYVRLEYDSVSGTKDKYSRTLAYVFMLSGTSYEAYMIANGFAHEYTYNNQKYKYQSDFKALQTRAQSAKKGFWADDTCAGNTTKPANAS